MISIIIPAYNCSATLSRTLASLVAQTDQNFKTIIVNDCSTEDIMPIVNNYSDELDINYICHKKNMGCGMARQTGIDNVKTSHFLFLDSDDILMPYTIETFNAFIKTNPQAELVCSYFYEQGKSIEGVPVYLLQQNGFTWCHGKLYSLEAVKRFNISNVPSIRWADDSYFNAICYELLNIQIIKLPTYIWTNTQTSAMRKKDSKREKEKCTDLLKAMILSCEFISQYKDSIDFVANTANYIEHKFKLSDEELKLLRQLRSFVK